MAAVQPSGTVTLVFTDIEGSTRLLEQLGTDGYRAALAEHRGIVRAACRRYEGYEVDNEGDAFFFAFGSAEQAASAVSELMTCLESGPIRIRVGIHTGEPALDPPKYVGLDVHRAARIMSAAHGGQVVLSRETADLLPADRFLLTDLGDHFFKDIAPPQRMYQLGGAEHPALKSLYRVDLPVPATPFLGREWELQAVVDLLARADTRVLTLTGPGGSGKTRLALQAATDVRRAFVDGVRWVALAPVRDPSLAIPSIATAVGVAEQPGESLGETLARALLGKRMLVLLDNAEHLLPDLARIVATLTDACPTLRLLVTSRERLQIGVETTWDVPTLGIEDAVELFAQRARAVRSDFGPGPDVVEICSRLDQLPLAIELAAARVRALSVDAILARLEDRLGLLTSRARDVDDRQRTLEATIAWSYDLLDDDERRGLRALSIFSGGCTLEAAEEVAAVGLDLIESLVDKSLVRHRLDAEGDDRYWMLETIRAYAEAQLDEAGERDDVFAAFLGWLDGLVGDVDELWVQRDQLEWFEALERDKANLLHGIAQSRERGEVGRSLRLLVAAREYIDAWGPYEAFADLVDGAECSDPELDGRARLLELALLLRLGRRHDESVRIGASLMAELRDKPVLYARLLSQQAANLVYLGDLAQATRLATAALELARAEDDASGVVYSLNVLGVAAMASGDGDAAHTHLRESQVVAEQHGDNRNAGFARANLALLLLTERKPREARELMLEVTEQVRHAEGPAMTAVQLCNLALALAASGDASGSRAVMREALDADAVQFTHVLAVDGLFVLAIAAAHDGSTGLATMLWAAAAAANEAFEYVVGPEVQVYVNDVLEPLRARRGFQRDWEHGRSLSIEDAFAAGIGQVGFARSSSNTDVRSP